MSKFKFQDKRTENSYAAYKRRHNEFKKQGYAMDRVLTKKRYETLYKLAQSEHEKNIARTFAYSDRQATIKEVRDINKGIRQGFKAREAIRDESGKISGYRKYYIMDSKKEKKFRESAEWKKIEKEGYEIVNVKSFDWEDVKKKGLKNAYKELLDQGYTPRQAGATIDEGYDEGGYTTKGTKRRRWSDE